MKFGYSLRYTLPLRDMPKLMKSAEEAGFDTGWFPDAQLRRNIGDPYAMLGVCSAYTNRIRMGIAVTNPFTRHLSVTANAICTIDELSQGRAVLGMGAGDAAVRPLGQAPLSAERCQTTIEQIKMLCGGEEINLQGVPMKFDRARSRIPPIYLAATGSRMLAVAGRSADGVILNVGINRNLVENAIRTVEKGAGESGRSKGPEHICCLLTFCLSENRQRAQDLVKPYLGYFQTFQPKLLEAAGASPNEIERLRDSGLKRALDLMHAEDYESTANETRWIPNELSSNFALGGNPEDFVRKIKELESLGVNEILLRPFFSYRFAAAEGDQYSILKTIGESVIPQFR